MQRDRGPYAEVAPTMRVSPPGRFGDGPVYVRVNRELAGDRWIQAGHEIEINDWRCAADPRHDYVVAENSHIAFIYARGIAERGVPHEALAVVRLVDARRSDDQPPS